MIKEIGRVITGNTPSKSNQAFYASDDIGFIKPDMISEEKITYIKSSKEFISEQARSKARIAGNKAVCVTCIGIIGKIGIIDGGEYAFNQQINVIEPNEKVSSEYLAYCLLYNRNRLTQMANAPVVPIINKTQFENFQITIEDGREEQNQIVERLSKTAHAINMCKQQMSQYELLIKSRFVELFGDPVQNPKGWMKKGLLDMGKCKNGMNFHYADTGIEINCLGVGDFKDLAFIDNTKNLPTISLNEMPAEEYILKDEDIVFVRSNGNKALVGRSLVVYPGAVPTTFSGFCIRYRKTDDSISIPYLLRVLKTDSMRQKMVGRGANIQNLNQQILRTLEIPIPPLELQKQFTLLVEQVDKLKTVTQKSINELQLLFDSLMQKYFG